MWARACVAEGLTSLGQFRGSQQQHERALEIATKRDDLVAVFDCLYWSAYQNGITGSAEGRAACVRAMVAAAHRARSRRMIAVPA
jgi:hypothetical protein